MEELEDVCITPQSSYAYACDMTSFYPVFESRDVFKLKPSHPLNLSSAVDARLTNFKQTHRMETLKQVDTFADKEKLGRRGVTSLTELGALHK